ncbi:MAG: hypothetical protein M1541_17780 [Acidobacteria bacterium]|nr:hypothetical protein [Acidobacteriota bacterium]
MKSVEPLLPEFGDLWIEHCMTLVDANGGVPPHIATPVYRDQTAYARAETVAGAKSVSAMNSYLQLHGSDLTSRFAVLRYLWAASVASAPCDSCRDWNDALFRGGIEAVQEEVDDELRSAVQPLLTDFVDRLSSDCITSPEQALWEFKQALILSRPDRLNAIAVRYRQITAQQADQSNLMLARALWLLGGRFWAKFIWQVVSGRGDLPWEAFVELGDSGSPLFPFLPPKSGHTAEDTDVLFDAIACIRKVDQRTLGQHWAVLADCCLGAGQPEECAKIWEQHGHEIVTCAAEAQGRQADEVLLSPDYQLPIADLWAEAGRIDKQIEVLESLRERHPRFAGVNRTLAECYLRMKPPNPELAAQRARDEAGCDQAFSEDSIVRLFLHEHQRHWEVERQLEEARERYENNPANGGQRTAIESVLRLAWSPFDRLSQAVQNDWVIGLWWCYADHGGHTEFDETERGENALTKCSRALETHLKETLFEPLRRTATKSEIDQLDGDTHPELKSYLLGRHFELGPMLAAIEWADARKTGVYRKLWDLLNKKCSKPKELQNEKWREITLIRNPSSHESRRAVSGASMERARHAVQLCHEFLSILESPPTAPPPVPRPGQPVPRR